MFHSNFLSKYQWGEFYKVSHQYKFPLPKLLMCFFPPPQIKYFATNAELFVLKRCAQVSVKH